MIQANELRLGNWVKYGENIIKVKNISPDGFSALVETICGDTEDYDPIPLTPEILEKAGFEYDRITYSKGSFWVGDPDVEGNFPVWLHGLGAGITCTIKYLHQLQNLYFDLTGTELQIEL